jgi:sulfonate transport system substrate-binding protein
MLGLPKSFGSATRSIMNELISRRSLLGGLGLIGAGLTQRTYAQGAPIQFRVGYQKAGLLSVAKEQGVFERRLKPLGIEAVKWSEFELGPPMMEALGADAIDFGWVGDVPGARRIHHPLSRGDQGQEGSLCPRHQWTKRSVEIARQGGPRLRRHRAVFLSPTNASAALSRGDVDVWVVHDPTLL